MATTTIRLDPRLKSRLAAAARRAGKTPHAFLLEAIAETVERSEDEAELDKLADERWAEFLETGEYVTLDDMKTYARALGRGERPAKPKVRKLRR